MHIEVDQSGKIEDLRQATVITFSNKEQFSVLFPRKLKREIFLGYRSKIRQLRFRLFAIGIFYCLENYLKNVELITICKEYTGKDAHIKTYLLPLIRKKQKDFDKKLINFGVIGKKSRAHMVAILTNKGIIKPNKILTKEEILMCLKNV